MDTCFTFRPMFYQLKLSGHKQAGFHNRACHKYYMKEIKPGQAWLVAPVEIWTYDRLVMSQLLWTTELRGHEKQAGLHSRACLW